MRNTYKKLLLFSSKEEKNLNFQFRLTTVVHRVLTVLYISRNWFSICVLCISRSVLAAHAVENFSLRRSSSSTTLDTPCNKEHYEELLFSKVF